MCKEEVVGQKEIKSVQSSLDESHKSMNKD
jgi:hypothetical protein